MDLAYSKRLGAATGGNTSTSSSTTTRSPHSLLDLSAKIVAEHIPFQSIEERYEHIPEPVQRRIIFWSFPKHEDDIKMYSSLSCGTFKANGPASSTANQSSASTTTNSNSTTQSSPSSNGNSLSNPNRPFAGWATEASSIQQQAANSASPTSSNVPTTFSNNNTNTNSTNKSNNQHKQLTFHKGLRLYNEGCVQDVLQVGFNLSGLVVIKSNLNNQSTSTNSKIRGSNNHANNNNNHSSSSNSNINLNNNNNNNNNINIALNNDALINQNHLASTSNSDFINSLSSSAADSLATKSFRVSVTFDRCKITSVSCSCELQDIFWCEHVVALILYRIRNPETIDLRVPISETLLSLDRQQLQKLVQYIIAEHHTEVLPTAQRLLDEMRQSFSEINQIQGAPDPTAGACSDDEHIWHLDEQQVNEKVQNYLNLVCNNSKDAVKQINALFEKIREMFRAKDSNGTRLLKLITEQFLQFATRNEKSRSLWDQLVSLWVVVMLNPSLSKHDRRNFIQLLNGWSKVPKCPKEDIERRVGIKRKAAELSDDEDSNDYAPPANSFSNEFPINFNQSNNYPAHMATHRHRAFQPTCNFPALRPYNQLPILPSTCPCQLPHSIAKKMRSHNMQYNTNDNITTNNNNNTNSNNNNNVEAYRNYRPSGSSNYPSLSRPSGSNSNENRPIVPQEPRSVFCRALDVQDATWDDPHLQLILNKDGPVEYDLNKSYLLDLVGNPLWSESISQAAARVETLRSYGHRDQALRLTVATVRRLKLHQDRWCLAPSPKSPDATSPSRNTDLHAEGWIGHPLDPINVLMDILLDASTTEVNNANSNSTSVINGPNYPCALNSTSRCACPYNQALADFTHRLLPDLASLSHQHRTEAGFPLLPLVNLAPRRTTTTTSNQNSDKTVYYHVPVPGCCQKDSYLTLAVEVALIALGQQRLIPSTATAHDRAVRQESDLINKLESIDTSDPLLMDILKHQTTLLLEGGPYYNACCGVSTDSAPLHTFARYLFDSLVSHCPQLAYKIGVYAMKMPLSTEEMGENFATARGSPRSINYNHLQSEQLALAQTMLSKAKVESSQQGNSMRKVYRASVKNIRNPTSLLKLSKHALKEAKPSGNTLYPGLLKTAFELGLQVLKLTLSPHTSNGKTRREAILFIVECATDMGLDSVLQVMRDSREHFSAIEALNLVVSRDNDQVNLRSQALSKLKLKENPIRESELNCRCRDLVLDCANRDPSNCALDALKFCETDGESLEKALEIVVEAGKVGTMDSTQLIKVADYIHERNMTDKAFNIAMVAVDTLSIPSNSDNSSSKKDIFSACEYAQKVNGFSTLIPKLIKNIECATVLSEIYHRFSPSPTPPLARPTYTSFNGVVLGPYQENINNMLKQFNPDLCMQRIEDARCWKDLLERAISAFTSITRTRMQNISPRHYTEFIDFLAKAQGIFEKAEDGPKKFKDLIAEIVKSYKTKKKLLERLKARFEYSIKAVL